MTIIPIGKEYSQQLPRQGESSSVPTRSKRFYAFETSWYFNTRDDETQGPFRNLGEAKSGLKTYLRRCGIVHVGD